VHDPETLRILEVNDAAVTHYGYAREEFISMTLPDLRPTEDVVEILRRVKDEGEIDLIRAASRIVDRAFEFILTLVRPGVSERDLATELEYFMKRAGSEKEAFDTIVASGARSALPHGRASDKLLEAGDFVTFDFGGRGKPQRPYNSQ